LATVVLLLLIAITFHNFLGVKLTQNNMKSECNQSIYDYKMDSPCLLELIQEWLHRKTFPAEGHLFDKNPPHLNGQVGAPSKVDEILGQMEGGFYIECGAHDGEQLSNSLFFELRRKWKGLLIEPQVTSYTELIHKNRDAFHINTCLSGSQKVQMANFKALEGQSSVFSKVLSASSDVNAIQNKTKIGSQVMCVPLYSLLLAIGNPTVDFFSLDIEGAEIPVLESIPWKKVKIRVILIEVNKIDKKVVNIILNDAGFCLYDKTKYDFLYAHSQYTNVCNNPKIEKDIDVDDIYIKI